MRAVQIHHHTGNERIKSVLRRAHALNPVCVHRKAFRVLVAGRSGEIQQNTIRTKRAIDRGRHGVGEAHFHEDIGAFAHSRDAFQHSTMGWALRGGKDREQNQRREIPCNFHFFLTLVGVPLAHPDLARSAIGFKARRCSHCNLATTLTSGMALIAINAVVDIAGHIIVLEIRRVVSAMAACALEYRVVIGIGVTCRADAVGIAVTSRELRVLRVVEARSCPRRGVMAVLARGREELRLRRVARICRVLVIRLMASDASRRQRRVVSVYVAVRALPWRHGVRTGQRKGRVVVVER